jgi:hypothetical protein
VRCGAGTPVSITTAAASGTAPSIDVRRGRARSVALTPGRAVTIEGRSNGGSIAYHVRCLPEDFPQWTETRTAPASTWTVVTPSLTLGQGATSNYVAIFDRNGVPVWWLRTAHPPIDAKILPGRQPLVAYSFFPASWPRYELRRLDGRLATRVRSPDGRADDHELQRLANGDFLYLVYEPQQHVDLSALGGPADGAVLDARIEEISPSGALVWSWSSDGHVGLDESSRWDTTILGTPVVVPGADGQPLTTYDFFHPNAISAVGRHEILLSLRQTDAVYAIDKRSGDVLWKLGGTRTPQSLTVLDDPFGDAPLGGQHDVRVLPDGTISIFDDGTFLGRPPRVVRYRIDPQARTATLVEQVSDPSVTASNCCGSARLIANGDWLVSWGGDPVVGEYRPDGTPVFTFRFDGGLFSYRAVAVAPRKLGIAQLRAGMDAMAKR